MSAKSSPGPGRRSRSRDQRPDRWVRRAGARGGPRRRRSSGRPAAGRTPPAGPRRSCGRPPKRWAARSSSQVDPVVDLLAGHDQRVPVVSGLMDRKATQRSSRQTNSPGISPSMISVKTEAMAPVVADLPWAAMEDAAAGEDRILTIPNIISVVRLLCVPVFLWLLFDQENRLAAAGLLAVLGATDWVDGYIARHYDQVSNLGKVLDPVADRVLLIVGVVAILIDGAAPLGVAVLSLLREGLVAVAVLVLAACGAAPHRRHVVRQGGHVLGDVRLPPVPVGERRRRHGGRPRLRGGLGLRHPRADPGLHRPGPVRPPRAPGPARRRGPDRAEVPEVPA